MAIVQEINLNLIPNSAPVIVYADQYDSGSGRLIIHLYDDTAAYDPGTGAVVTIQGTKPDRKSFTYSASISGNTVTADVTEQMTAAAGDVRTQVVVTESTGRTGSFVFILRVQKSALPEDADLSRSDLQLIEEGIEAAAGVQEYALAAERSATAAAGSAASAGESELTAEAFAAGTRRGTPVPSTDPAYQNSAKYYKDQAAVSASSAAISATAAAGSRDAAAQSESNAAASASAAGTSAGNAASSASDASGSARDASDSATAAGASATAADGSASDAEEEATLARSYARGGTGTRSGEDTDNAKYYKEQARAIVSGNGHVIQDAEETSYHERTNLRFMNAQIADNSQDDATEVTVCITEAEWSGIRTALGLN